MRTIITTASTVGLLFAFLYPRYLFLNFGGVGINAYQVVTIALLLLSLVTFVIRSPWQPKALVGIARGGVVVGMFLIYYGWRIVADMAGNTPGPSLGITMQELFGTGCWLIIAAILWADDSIRQRVPVLIGIGVTIAGLFGILEAATQTPIFELLHFTAVAKIDPALLEVLTHGSSEEGQNRIKSIFNHPIIFGQVMAMTSPLFLHLILHTRGNTRLLGISQAIVTVVSLVICDSRSPLIVFSVSIIFFFFLFNFDIRSRRRLFLFFIGLLVAAFAAPIAVDYTVGLTVGESDRDIRSGQVRVLQLQRGQDALSRSPITGYGSGSAIGYAGVRNNTTQVMTLDNYYLTLSVDSGYIGASIFIIMIFIFILFGGITTFNSELTEDRSALASFVALIAGFIPGMTIVSIPDALTYVYMAAGFFLAETGSRVVEARRAAFMSARGVHGTVLSPGLGKAS